MQTSGTAKQKKAKIKNQYKQDLTHESKGFFSQHQAIFIYSIYNILFHCNFLLFKLISLMSRKKRLKRHLICSTLKAQAQSMLMI